MPIPLASSLVPYVAPAAATKLSLLTKALVGGSLVTGIPGLFGLPGMVEENIISQPKTSTGKFKTGIFSRTLDFLDGEGDRFSQEGLAKTKSAVDFEKLKNNTLVQERAGIVGIEPLESDKSATAFLARTKNAFDKQRRKDESDDYTESPAVQDAKSRLLIEDGRRYSLDNRALDVREDAILGQISSNDLATRLSHEANKERMFTYRQDLQTKRENDRYKTTAGLIGGLSALGAAFAL